MNKFDIVKLINHFSYKVNGLKKDMHGIIVEAMTNQSKVLFFNEQNIGDAIIVEIKNQDLFLEKEKLSDELKNELSIKIKKFNKNKFDELKFKAYDKVKLVVDDEKYARQGIVKGMQGCVMENYAENNRVLVDFSGVDKKGRYYGDCIYVNIEDLEIIN